MKKLEYTASGLNSVDELIGVLQQISRNNLGHLHIFVGDQEKSIKKIKLYEYENVVESDGRIMAIKFILE